MKPGSQVPRMAMYLNDKGIIRIAARVSVYMHFMAKSLIIYVYVRLRT